MHLRNQSLVLEALLKQPVATAVRPAPDSTVRVRHGYRRRVTPLGIFFVLPLYPLGSFAKSVRAYYPVESQTCMTGVLFILPSMLSMHDYSRGRHMSTGVLSVSFLSMRSSSMKDDDEATESKARARGGGR